MDLKLDRRKFIGTLSVVGAGLTTGLTTISFAQTENPKPALMGGPKAHPSPFPGWPVVEKIEEKSLLNALHSKTWGRLNGKAVANFEEAYQKLTGAKYCLGVSSGTSALFTALGVLDIGPGDEVIIPVYTFIATYNVVVLNYALPIFADTDIESFQIDTKHIESAISKQTKVLMPVHMGGSPADLDTLLSIAEKHQVPLLEDACQAHLAEWKGKKVGTLGLAGAFSFQSSKNLNSGEGGALLTNEETFAEKCYNFHNQGRLGQQGNSYTATRGSNLRLTEFQGEILLAQMSRVIDQTNRRTENANYLTSLLKEIPGIKPAVLYEGVTKSAYHLYMFRFIEEEFGSINRSKFLQALQAEGVPCSGGYGKMNQEKYVKDLAKNPHYLKIYGEKGMQEWLEKSDCPQNDVLCEQAVWLGHSLLLGSKKDMDQIAEAVLKIHNHSGELSKA